MPYNKTMQGFRGIGQGIGEGFYAFTRSRMQQLEQEKKGKQEEIQNLEKATRIFEKYQKLDPGSPLSPLYEEQMRNILGYVPGQEVTPPQHRTRPVRHTPLGDLEAKFARPMMQPRLAGETALRASPQMRADILAPKPPPKPTASTISFARRAQEKYIKAVDEAETKIAQMRRDLKIEIGEQPKTPRGIGKGKEQRDLDNWNRLHKSLSIAQASLDSLRRKAKERGIDLEFGAPTLPTPEQIGKMSIEEILRMISAGGR